MLELASHIVETKAGHFEPEKFEDQYEDALKELLKKKQEGKPIEAPSEREPTNVVNLMDALRRSVETERAGGGERRKPAPRAAIIARRRRLGGPVPEPRRLDSLFEEQLSNAAGNSLASRSYGRRTSHQDQQRRQIDPMDYFSF